MNNSNIKKSDLTAKELHLKDDGNSKLVKNFLEHVYWVSVIGNSIPNEIKQSDVSTIKTVR